MPQFAGSLVSYPARVTFAWYLTLVIVGSLLLRMPICNANNKAPIDTLDAIFTAASATCVTGLAVRSTEHDFSLAGQVVILGLIQLGGIGIMTVTTFIIFHFGRQASLRDRAVVAATLGASDERDLSWILKHVVLFTLLFEAAGFVLLGFRNLWDNPAPAALWQALFHSVSAFCNAGFSLHDDSLSRYAGDPLVNFTVCGLIVCGGIGFPVMLDLKRNSYGPIRDRWNRLMLHSKMMLIGTAALIVLGAVSVLILEWDGVLRPMGYAKRLQVALFHSVTSRTAGFNTIDVARLTNATLFVTILLMTIGAGPCSTGGGLKVSTVMVLGLRAWSTFRGRVHVNLFRRAIPEETTNRAGATTMLFAIVAVIALVGVLAFEQSWHPHAEAKSVFLDALFEIVSALATVGLSLGLTAELSDAAQCITIGLMFIGRLGPISVFAALSRTARTDPYKLPAEEPLIG